jgi:hypothetical protein
MLLGLVAVPPVHAVDASAPAHSTNLGDHEYSYDRWANPVNSYLVPHEDGTLTRVEYTGKAVVAETYDSGLKFVNGLTIDMELPLFGGFYYGETCNFLVFGQENPTEDDTQEVVRVVSYTRDWKRIGAASLCGANTCIPFDAGSLRFAECNGYLYIRTAHEMYMSTDGRNHQSNLTLNVRISDMEITDSFYEVMNVNYGYVSHSFNQFIAVDGNVLLTVDHGDAHPRSVVLMRYYTPAGKDTFTDKILKPTGNGYYTYTSVEYVDVLPISGSSGDNDTGVSVGGFEISDSAYLIVGNTSPQGDDYDPFGQRNIFVSVTSKEDFSATGTEIRYLTSYTQEDDVVMSNPHFVKINANKFAVIWTEETADSSTMRYAFLNGNGQLISQIYSAKGVLSDCQPVVSGNKLVWYVTSASAPAFFTIDLDAPENVTCDHVYSYTFASYPMASRDGSLRSTCKICGVSGPSAVVPALLNREHYTVYGDSAEPTCTASSNMRVQWKDAQLYNVPNYIFSLTAPALGHNYGAWYTETASTCTQEGVERHDCTRCDHYETRAIEVTDHSYTYEVTTAPTIDAVGTLTGTCIDCADTDVVTLPMLNDTDYTYTVVLEPTDTAAGIGRYTWNDTTYGTFYFEVALEVEESEKIMLGDIDGNGIIDTTDYMRAKAAFLGTFELSEAQFLAADVDKNGVIDTTDCLRIKAHFLGTFVIE